MAAKKKPTAKKTAGKKRATKKRSAKQIAADKARIAKSESTRMLKGIQERAKFLELYESSGCNVGSSAKGVGIHRATYYKWREAHAEFADACDEIREAMHDDIEAELLKRARFDDSAAALIFLCKTKLKHRGYIERKEVDNSGEIPVAGITLNFVGGPAKKEPTP